MSQLQSQTLRIWTSVKKLTAQFDNWIIWFVYFKFKYVGKSICCLLTAYPTPIAAQAVNKHAPCMLGQPITVSVSSPGIRPIANSPLAYSSAYNKKSSILMYCCEWLIVKIFLSHTVTKSSWTELDMISHQYTYLMRQNSLNFNCFKVECWLTL